MRVISDSRSRSDPGTTPGTMEEGEAMPEAGKDAALGGPECPP
jgi:hypothetical protein